MSSWLETKFVNLVSSRFSNLKQKSGTLWNFSCPLCGDSEVNKKKARAYIFYKSSALFFFCHNCQESMSFPNFLKRVDYRLYTEFKMESLKAVIETGAPKEQDDGEQDAFDQTRAADALARLKKISSLPLNHPAARYIRGRKIPNQYHAILRWCPTFMQWTNDLLSEPKFKKEALQYDIGRIIIPFCNRTGVFHAYQGRSMEADGVRYISIPLNEEPMIFGVERVKFQNDIFAFEGPLDATFVSNSVAFAGSSFFGLTKVLPSNKLVCVYDNEPHSKDTNKKIRMAIEHGLRVCIWPDNVPQKDVNKMIEEGGYSAAHIEHIISQNIYEGLFALTRLASWSKVNA